MSWVDDKLGINAGVWYAGAALPPSSIGKNLDFYLIIGAVVDSGTVYHKMAGIWTIVGSLSGGGGGGTLGGNVVGSASDNRVAAISGDPSDDIVEVFAHGLHWSPTVADGEPEISVSPDAGAFGALQILSEGKRALLASANAPELGNDTAIDRIRGGVRLTTRSIAADVTLDTSTKDAVAWIGSPSSRQVTLPPASVGRTVILPFVGATTHTLKRRGLELINGVAADFTMTGDAQGGLALAVSDGTNWIARTIAVPAPSGVPTSRTISTTAPLLGGGDLTANRTLSIDPTAYVAPTRSILVAAPITGGGSLSADRTIGLDTSALVLPTRTISTTAPLLGGGDLSANRTFSIDPLGFVAPTRTVGTTAPLTGGGTLAGDLTLGINPAAYVAPTRTISVTAPLTGGGTLAADRTIGIDTSSFILATRTISTTAPLLGGGDLSANRTLSIDPLGFVAPTRTVSTTAPLSGGGALSANLTIGLDPTGYVAPTLAINTTAPLTGGGNLSTSRTLAVSDATNLANGVIRLASNLGGTAAAPLVTGLTADTISIQTAAAAAKGSWTNQGLRIGDATAPTSPNKLEVLGQAQFGSAAAKVTVGGLTGSEATLAALWMGTAALTTTNYALLYDTSNSRTAINAIGNVAVRIGGVDKGNWNTNGLRIGDTTAATDKLEAVGNILADAASAKITAKNTNTVFDLTTAAPCFVAEANAASGNAIFLGIVNSIRRGGIRYDSGANCSYNATNHHFYSGLTTGTPLASLTTGGLRIGDTATATKKLEVLGDCTLGKTDGTSAHQIYGSQVVSVRSIASDLTVDASAFLDYLILVDSSAAARIITLPAATFGRIITVKRQGGSNTVDVKRSGASLIEIATMITARLSTDPGGSGIHPYVTLVGDGSHWKILRHFSCTLQTT